ncbi:MAG: FtsX-like permease family protein [Alphaproteobacteria bacterium]
MNDINFIYYSLKSRWLNSSLSIFLTAFGLAIAIIVNQFSYHFDNRLKNDGKNIDIVIGAKGSPLQLVLSTVYHIDIPTGNISYNKVKKYLNSPQIEYSIPLALGDNWNGYRIVGTNYDYIKHYKGELEHGREWNKNFEIVVGSSVKIEINDEIKGAHGLVDTGKVHSDEKYKVVGILKPTGTVIDRLLFTSLNSVLEIHNLHHLDEKDHHEHHNEESKEDHHEHHKEEIIKKDNHHIDDHSKNDEKHEHTQKKATDVFDEQNITAFLIKTNNPIANINLPRLINKESSMQAANPAFEITRLSSMLGIGSKGFKFLSIILIIIAALSVFSGLAGNLENRLKDLAVLRAIGYTKQRIFKIITLEGGVITFIGIIVGISISLISFNILATSITPLNMTEISFTLTKDFFLIILLVLLSGIFAAVFPAYRGSKISVAKQLSENI